MYARVARWEGGDGEALRRAAQEMNARAEEGPPPGVPATGFMLLLDADAGTTVGISLFETEEDMRTGHEALNAMDPDPGANTGRRTSVEMFEVAVDIRT